MPEDQLTNLARALALAGGVILVVAGTLELANRNVSTYINSPLVSFPGREEGALAIVAGILALSGHRQLQATSWNLLMIVLGIVIGGLGGILVLVAGLVSLVVAQAEKTASVRPSS